MSKPMNTDRSVAWPAFADRLAKILASMKEDQFLILSARESGRYVQFACAGAKGFRAETTSDLYVRKEERLQSHQVSALIDAGWNAPSRAPGDPASKDGPPGSPNFFRNFEHPVDFAEVADLAVHTMADVLRIPHPRFLEYNAFRSTGAKGTPLDFPELGIARVRPKPPASNPDLPGALLAVIRKVTGIAEIDFDKDGDLAFRSGSTGALIHLIGDPPHVRVRAPILQDVELSPALLVRLNDINVHETVTRFVFRNDAIWAVADICARPFTPEHVEQTLKRFLLVADAIDSVLREEFGGRTAFPEDLPSTTKH